MLASKLFSCFSELIIDVQFGAAPYIGASVPTLAYSPYLAATAGLAVSPLLGNDQTQLLSHGAPGQPQHQHAGQTPADPQQLQQQTKQRNDRLEVSYFQIISKWKLNAKCPIKSLIFDFQIKYKVIVSQKASKHLFLSIIQIENSQ